MLPVLLDLKFVKIYTFGVFLVLAFFWGSFLLWKNIRLTQHKEEEIFDGLFLSLLGGLFFGRLVYVILNFKSFGINLGKFILINGYPGISLFGSIFGGFLVVILYLYFKKIKIVDTLDYFISPLFFALAIGKLGSFFGGVEVGTKIRYLFGIHYAGFDGSRHPTAFYESLFFFFAAYWSYRMLFEIRKDVLKNGFLIAFFVWAFSLDNFVFDKIKINVLYFYGFRFNWMISAVLLLTSSVYFLYYFRSTIGSGIGLISNFLTGYGQKTIKIIHHKPKNKTREGEGKNTQAG